MAVIALAEISLANLACTVPLADGRIVPSMIAILPVVSELALAAAGTFAEVSP
jgi:hypothetical protein